MSFFRPVPDEAKHVQSEVHVNLDIESMGVKPGCPVITIGAVLFNPTIIETYDALMARAFLRRIDVEDAVNHSNGVEGGTLAWWLAQEDEAIKALLDGDAVPVSQALQDFFDYCKTRGLGYSKKFFENHHKWPVAIRVWAKSPDFDCKIMESLYDRMPRGQNQFPFKFYEFRCMRTIQELAWPDPDDRPRFVDEGSGVAHDARHDAVTQAMAVQAAYRVLGLSSDNTTYHA
jgi:exodeoxyribonuclease VIII